MAPFLAGGERLVWRPPDPAPRFGDVIIFCQPSRRAVPVEGPGGEDVPETDLDAVPEAAVELRRLLAGSLVVHRVVGRAAGGRLITKGDNLPHLDRETVDSGAVLGVVRAVREPGGALRELEGRGPRFYGAALASSSRLGAAVYRPAASIDALIRRMIPGMGERRLARLLARAVQRSAQATLHRLLYRACHGRRRAGYRDS
jgi:hypothetical protein